MFPITTPIAAPKVKQIKILFIIIPIINPTNAPKQSPIPKPKFSFFSLLFVSKNVPPSYFIYDKWPNILN